MAPDPLVAERAYSDIKRALLAGRFRLAERLDVLRLAEHLGVSATPVREALSRLAVERLVRFEPKRGYFARLWTESELRSLYMWRKTLALLALTETANPAAPALHGEYPARVRLLMEALGAGCNPELAVAASNADDRLERARQAEPSVLANADQELERIADAFASGQRALAGAVRSFYQRRERAAGDIRAAAVLAAVGDNGAEDLE